jgi:hypothetical protein
VKDEAGIVDVGERCSGDRDRHDVAGTRIHVREYFLERKCGRWVRGRRNGERESYDTQQSYN